MFLCTCLIEHHIIHFFLSVSESIHFPQDDSVSHRDFEVPLILQSNMRKAARRTGLMRVLCRKVEEKECLCLHGRFFEFLFILFPWMVELSGWTSKMENYQKIDFQRGSNHWELWPEYEVSPLWSHLSVTASSSKCCSGNIGYWMHYLSHFQPGLVAQDLIRS